MITVHRIIDRITFKFGFKSYKYLVTKREMLSKFITIKNNNN